jgi:hypothetical protein
LGAVSAEAVKTGGARRAARSNRECRIVAETRGARQPQLRPGRARCVCRSATICTPFPPGAERYAAQHAQSRPAAPPGQRGERWGAVAQLRDAPAVQELQRLRDELDVADAARVELHVEAVAAGALLLADPLLPGADATHARVVHRRAVDHRMDRAHGAPAEFEVTGDRPRLHEGDLLPVIGRVLVVLGEHRVRNGGRTGVAFGPQVEVDAVQEAILGLGLDETRNSWPSA